MKTLKEGHGQPWWIGQKHTCDWCGRVVEIEKDDHKGANWIHGFDKVGWLCGKCQNLNEIARSDCQFENKE